MASKELSGEQCPVLYLWTMEATGGFGVSFEGPSDGAQRTTSLLVLFKVMSKVMGLLFGWFMLVIDATLSSKVTKQINWGKPQFWTRDTVFPANYPISRKVVFLKLEKARRSSSGGPSSSGQTLASRRPDIPLTAQQALLFPWCLEDKFSQRPQPHKHDWVQFRKRSEVTPSRQLATWDDTHLSLKQLTWSLDII